MTICTGTIQRAMRGLCTGEISSHDSDRLVTPVRRPRKCRSGSGRSHGRLLGLLRHEREEDQSDVVPANVDQTRDQVLDGGVFPLGPVSEEVPGGARLLLQGALLEGSDPGGRVAEIPRQGFPVVVIPTSVQHGLHLPTFGRANLTKSSLLSDYRETRETV